MQSKRLAEAGLQRDSDARAWSSNAPIPDSGMDVNNTVKNVQRQQENPIISQGVKIQ